MNNFACKYCKKGFRFPYLLENHEEGCEKGNKCFFSACGPRTKKYKCDDCGLLMDHEAIQGKKWIDAARSSRDAAKSSHDAAKSSSDAAKSSNDAAKSSLTLPKALMTLPKAQLTRP